MAATHEDRNASLSPGVAIKAPCRAATTAAITLSGEQTIDAVACVTGDRVLVKNQTSSIANGIYGCSTGAWAREPDFDGNRDVVTGTFVFITSGATNAGAFYECTTTGTVVFGTSNITFAQGALGPIAIPISGSNVTFTQSGTPTANSVAAKLQQIISVKDAPFNALGDGVTDDTAAIQAAINFAFLLGCILYFPAGIYLCASTLIFKNKVTYIGAGKDSSFTVGTVIKYTGASDATQINNPINSSTAANITVQDIWILCTTRTAGKAALADVGSTFLSLKRVGASGNDFSFILDQTEISLLDECECNLPASAAGGIWLVNGAEHTGGASAGFTNRISIKHCQINGGTSGVGIADDGGLNHSIEDNNFNGCNKQIRANAVSTLSVRNNQMEAVTTTAIEYATTKLGGGAGSSNLSVEQRGNTIGTTGAINAVTFSNASCITEFEHVGNFYSDANAGAVPLSGLGNVNKVMGYNNRHSGPGSATVGNLVSWGTNTVTYSASMTFDPALGQEFDITATNNTAFTINAPSAPYIAGQRITVVIRNTSGGALGAVTWNGVFKMSAWTQPANAFSRSIDFRTDGTNWVQISQTGVDVPN